MLGGIGDFGVAGVGASAHLHGEHEVLGHPHRLEAGLLGFLRRGDPELRVHGLELETDLHTVRHQLAPFDSTRMTSNVSPPTRQKKLRMLSRSFQSATVIGVAGMPRARHFSCAPSMLRVPMQIAQNAASPAALEDLELTARRVTGDEADGLAAATLHHHVVHGELAAGPEWHERTGALRRWLARRAASPPVSRTPRAGTRRRARARA